LEQVSDISLEDLAKMTIYDFPLLVKDLSKQYENSGASTIENDHVVRKKALDGLNLLLQNNEIFGLLG
jgi:ABC-type multidrug transport system ATPase subunit